MKKFITHSCLIEAQKIYVNQELYLDFSELEETSFAKEVYKHIGIEYPKFYKMDKMSKLAFLAAEILASKSTLKQYSPDRIGMVFSNTTSSLDTDLKHQKDIQHSDAFFPSPAVFVYTLANICMGEVAIRNSIKGENCFHIFEKFNAPFYTKNISILFEMNKIDLAMGAWTEVLETPKTLVFLVEKEGETELTNLNLEKLI